MKQVVLASAAILALSTATQAADLGSVRAPIAGTVASPVFNWTGFYLGGHLGASFPSVRYTVPGFSGGISSTGFMGGGQIGFNYQINQFVLGAEADLSGTTASRTFRNILLVGDATRISNPLLASVRARAGVAVDRVLFYATGGLGFGTATARYTAGGFAAAASSTRTGWTLGGGVEYAFAPNWTAKVEYLYYNFGTVRNSLLPGDRTTFDVHTVKVGVNYLFSTGPAPVSARY